MIALLPSSKSVRLIASFMGALFLVSCGGASSGEQTAVEEVATTNSGKEGSGDKAQADGSDPSLASASDMVLGDPNAPVTLIEYASVTCPGCAAFHKNILPGIKEKFVDTGKVQLVFREFPTPPVDFSLIGSVMARCAAEKGGKEAYFLVIDALFNDQRGWIYGEDPKVELLKIAAQAGMDETAFDACLKRQELVDGIQARVKEGSETFNINSTPSFVMNGEKISVRSLEDFEKALNEAIEKDAS